MAASVTNHWLAVGTGEEPPHTMADIDVPTLVLHGTEDPLFPLPHGEALAAEIRGARLSCSQAWATRSRHDRCGTWSSPRSWSTPATEKCYSERVIVRTSRASSSCSSVRSPRSTYPISSTCSRIVRPSLRADLATLEASS